MNDVRRVAIAARVFTLAVIASTALIGDVAVDGVWYVAGIVLVASVLSLGQLLPEPVIAVLEAVATAAVAVTAFPLHEAAFPYLATPVLIGGIAGGFRLVALALAAEAVTMGGLWWSLVGSYDSDMAASAVTWLITGLGLGLLGTFTRHNVTRSGTDASYRSALDLIKQLHALSGRLTSGLDPVDIANQAMAVVAEELVIRQAVVMLRQNGEFTPLRYSHSPLHLQTHDADNLLWRAWQTNRPALGGSRVALPMSTESERVAVVLADCLTAPDEKAANRATDRLATITVQMNAALLFTAVREAATSEERQRLAREVHDGVAQDVASLGYLVDNLAAVTTDPEQVSAVSALRKEVTRVIAELRNSVFDLRNETNVTQGLGQSIAEFARHVGSHSDLRVHVSLDESAIRLRPRVEAELLRITQEAINNARRHSGGTNLWVHCLVQPPRVQIDIVDDGDGLGTPREDSHGLRIMRERAERIDATLMITSPDAGDRGTRISILLQ